MNEEDPTLTEDEWLPIFLDYLRKVTQRLADYDFCGWIRTKRPELCKELQAAESEFQNLSKSSARLSEVMKVIRRWGDLVLQIQNEQNQKNK